MACFRTAIFLALLCAEAFAAELPPHWINVEDHNGLHGVNNPNYPLDINADLAVEFFVIPALVRVPPLNQEENVEILSEELTPEINNVDELTMIKIQEENDEQTDDETEVKYALQMRANNKVPCDFIASPRFSCYSCYTYIDCRSNGEGRIRQCSSPYAPYCNEGLCSASPTAECDPKADPEDLEEASGDPNLN